MLERFLRLEIAAPGLLLFAVAAALACANSPAHEWYERLWHTEVGLAVGEYRFMHTLHAWVNDGLMAIFFFLAGLEIKRELVVGELSSTRKAILPALAALGGMLFPALIYVLFNYGEESIKGWGIPMATDIAFATGCLALLGRRVPSGLVVFLLALAIVDDLGSVLVIALFYSDSIEVFPLVVGGALIACSFLLSRLRVQHTWPYALLGILVWLAFYDSGVHATVAGVLLAFTIPSAARYETHFFIKRLGALNEQFHEEERYRPAHPRMVSGRQQDLIRTMMQECQYVEAPLQRLEHSLHPFVLFVIMPIFAFANGGLQVSLNDFATFFKHPVTQGVFFGLLVGKQLGVMLFSFAAVRMGWAALPQGITWLHVYGMSWLAGIGFTMSMFVGDLAFPIASSPDPALAAQRIAEGKAGILLASLVAGVVGYFILHNMPSPSKISAAPQNSEAS